MNGSGDKKRPLNPLIIKHIRSTVERYYDNSPVGFPENRIDDMIDFCITILYCHFVSPKIKDSPDQAVSSASRFLEYDALGHSIPIQSD